MDFDFNLILVPVTLVFFAVWLLDKLVLKQRKTKGRGNENFIVTWAYDFWPVLAVVLVLRSFLFEPFNIPSDSMVPTLETGDFILVNKYQYGVRLPLTNTKIFDVGSPQRGEVFVFRYPVDPKVSFIKRVVGLPGDRIVYDQGKLFINDVLVQEKAIDFSRDKDRFERTNVKYTLEQLGQHTHLTRHLEGDDPLLNAFNYAQAKEQAPFVTKVNDRFEKSNGQSWEVTVPKGYYFAMGDNRDQSSDSRFWGFVPEENLIGHAVYVWMHKEPGFNFPQFSRNGAIK